MPITLDLTRDRFDMVEFGESKIFFDPAWQQRGANIVFPVWGATLLPRELARNGVEIDFSHLKDDVGIYIAGYSWLAMEQVCFGSLSVTLYQPTQSQLINFMRHLGKGVTLSAEWGEKRQDAYSYEVNYVLAWPYGGLALTLQATGRVVLSFNESDCIAARDYVKDTKRYGRQARSHPPQVPDLSSQ